MLQKIDYSISWEETKEINNKSLKVNNYFLQSKYHPEKESKRKIKDVFQKNYLYIVFGLGDILFLKELINRLTENEYLYIFEPSNELYQEITHNSSLDINHKRVRVVIFEEGNKGDNSLLAKMLDFDKRIKVIISPNYDMIFQGKCKSFLELIKEKSLIKVIEKNTAMHFSQDWQENVIENLISAHNAEPLQILHKKFDCPVVVVSSGPSLMKQIPLLKKYENNVIIICGGSTINTLLNNDITPDMIVTVDGGAPNFKHFESIEISQVPLAYSLHVNAAIPKKHRGLHYVFHNKGNNGLSSFLESLLKKPIVQFYGGGSVANFAFEIATYITTGEICLVGQDLAYTNSQTHSEGNLFNKKITDNDIKNRRMDFVDGYNGDKVLTDSVFLSMKRDFEELYKITETNGKVFNCTEGGVKIEQIPQIPFRSFIINYCENDRTFEKEMMKRKETVQNDTGTFIERINELKRELNTVESKCEKALTLLKNKSVLTNKNILKLNKIDEEIKTYLVNDFLVYIMQPVIHKIQHDFLEQENETNLEKENRILLQTKTLYSGILESVRLVIANIERELEEIDK